jgi:hypothetical protein
VTIARNSGGEMADEAGWPWSHRRTFLERLSTQGYAGLSPDARAKAITRA